MKKSLILLALSTVCLLGQSLDFSSLDKLAAKAKEVNRVSLDENQLRAALQMLSADKGNEKDMEQVRKLASGLTSVTVRNFAFAKPGQYRDADLNDIRSQFAKLKNWAKIIDTKEANEHSEIYMLTEGDKPAGFAVISAESQEVSVVFIKGALKLNDLGGLGGLMGLPTMRVGPNQSDETKK